MDVHGHSLISGVSAVHGAFEKCCVLTKWKFTDFHVNQLLATNGNEQFVWIHVQSHCKILIKSVLSQYYHRDQNGSSGELLGKTPPSCKEENSHPFHCTPIPFVYCFHTILALRFFSSDNQDSCTFFFHCVISSRSNSVGGRSVILLDRFSLNLYVYLFCMPFPILIQSNPLVFSSSNPWIVPACNTSSMSVCVSCPLSQTNTQGPSFYATLSQYRNLLRHSK